MREKVLLGGLVCILLLSGIALAEDVAEPSGFIDTASVEITRGYWYCMNMSVEMGVPQEYMHVYEIFCQCFNQTKDVDYCLNETFSSFELQEDSKNEITTQNNLSVNFYYVFIVSIIIMVIGVLAYKKLFNNRQLDIIKIKKRGEKK